MALPNNFRNAPILKYTEQKDSRCGSDNFYLLPQDLMDAVMAGLHGNAMNQLKLMIILLGTREGFSLTEEYMLERMKVDQQAYLRARKALINKGWLKKEKGEIIVDIAAIWEDYYDYLRKKDFSECR